MRLDGAYGAVRIRSESITISQMEFGKRGQLCVNRASAICCEEYTISPVWVGAISNVLSSNILNWPFLHDTLRLTTGAPMV